MKEFGGSSLIALKSNLINVRDWPSGDGFKYCCLHRDKEPRHGFLMSQGLSLDENAAIEVNLGYIFDGGTGAVIRYQTVNALIADGWKVD